MNRLPMQKIAAIAFDSASNCDSMLDRCDELTASLLVLAATLTGQHSSTASPF